MTLKKTCTFHNGVEIPQFGLGVFRIAEGEDIEKAVLCALEHGYRSIDTASLYGNEEGVGRAILKSGIPREEIFVTTKVWNTQQGYQNARQAFFQSKERLQLDYIDLYLIHWPIPSLHFQTWQALEELYEEKEVRAIGVSNFYIHHLEPLLEQCRIAPMINQVELHPLLQLPELRRYCTEHNICIEAWAPIMRGKVRRITLLSRLAEKYKKTPVQIALRWAWQNGIVVIPKSSNPQRIRSNTDIFDFSLEEEEMQKIAALDRGRRLGPHPDNFAS